MGTSTVTGRLDLQRKPWVSAVLELEGAVVSCLSSGLTEDL